LTPAAHQITIAAVDPTQISDSTLLGKFIRLPFKLLPAGAVVRVLRGPARGKRWVADSSTRGFWLGYWELDNQRFFAAHLKPGDVVYDIGAHVGLYTLISSSRVQPGGHIYAFEPLPRNLGYLRRHIDLNHVSNCTVVDVGVSDSTGPKRFDPTVHDSDKAYARRTQLRSTPRVPKWKFCAAAEGLLQSTHLSYSCRLIRVKFTINALNF
jgi:FkbM family methyltransferase